MIYTIGYAGTTIDRFIEIIKSLHVDILIDVRSLPKSKYFSDFNDVGLSKILAKNNIIYENWNLEFGARQFDKTFYTDNIIDYNKFAKSMQFQSGISKIQELINHNKNICLMCSEIDPINCHRAILCAKELYLKNIESVHIIAKRNGETIFESHKDFEQRLLLKLNVNNLDEAYKIQNKKIGYKLT